MATMPRVIVMTHEDEYRFDLTESDTVSLTTACEVNGEHSMTITTLQELDKGDRVLHRDRHGVWHEYVVESCESVHDVGDALLHTYWCPWSLMHDLSGTVVTGMPGTGGTPATATTALTAALAGTARWSVGTVDVTATGSASFWRMSGWEALQELVKVWGGEIRADVTVGSSGVTARAVSLLLHVGESSPVHRFDFGYDVSGITRTVEDVMWTARVMPLGAAAETGDGYGRKITIESVNSGVAWLENADTKDLTRVPDGNGGWEYPVQVVENPEAKTPADLKAWAQANLGTWTTPKVSYAIDVVELTQDGTPIDLAEGDEVIVVDTTLGLRLSARVVRIDEDLIDESNTVVTVSNVRDSLGDTLGSMSSATAVVSESVDLLLGTLGTIKTSNKTADADSVSAATSTYTSLASLTLEQGLWLLTYNARFEPSDNGARYLFAHTSAASNTTALRAGGVNTMAVQGSGRSTFLNAARVVQVSAATQTWHAVVWQNSGSTLAVNGFFRATRIR